MKNINKKILEAIDGLLKERYNDITPNIKSLEITETMFGDSVDDPVLFLQKKKNYEKQVSFELKKYFPKARIFYSVIFKPSYSGMTPSPDIEFDTFTPTESYEKYEYENEIQSYLQSATEKVWNQGRFW